MFIKTGLAKFSVVLSNDRPPPNNGGTELDGAGYRKCGTFDGTPAAKVTLECTDPKSGRYVYVYVAATTSMTICEVKAYAGSTPAVGKLKVVDNSYIHRSRFLTIN